MEKINSIFVLMLTILISACANSQNQNQSENRLVGGPCEGCEAIFEYGDKKLSSPQLLSRIFKDHEPQIKVSGTVYQSDGKTPAKDVILYLYHTE